MKKHGCCIELLPGRNPSDCCYGIEVARIAGFPANVAERAVEIRRQLAERSGVGDRPDGFQVALALSWRRLCGPRGRFAVGTIVWASPTQVSGDTAAAISSYALAQKLLFLTNSTLERDDLRRYLASLRQAFFLGAPPRAVPSSNTSEE